MLTSSIRHAVAGLVAAVALSIPSLGQTHNIDVVCCGFTDSVTQTNQTTIAAGTTVVWTVMDSSFHTVTNGSGSSDPTYGTLFDSPLDPTNPIVTYQFTVPGVYPYFCQPHEFSGMNGTITVTVAAQSTSTGTGCTGSNSQVFSLTTVGLPQLGNPNFAFQLSGGVPSAQAFFFIATGVANPPLPIATNCHVYLDLASLLALISAGTNPIGPFPLSPTGTVTFPVPLPNNPMLMGATISLQGYCPDAGAPAGLILTNALTVTLGV